MTHQTSPPEGLDIASVLARLPLFSVLTPELITHLVVAARERSLARGEVLFHRGDPSKGFYVVVTGQIKLAFSSERGNEKVVELIGPQQSFGEAVMFMDRPFPVFAEALADCRLLYIGRDTVFQLIDVESYSLQSSMQRVIGYLLQHVPDQTGSAELALPTSKQVIASRLNLTPETLSRILHELAEAQLIRVHGRQITIIDLARLRQFGL